jgi:hypothetical protein
MIEDLAIGYVSQSEGTLRSIHFALMVLGGIVAGGTNTSRSEIQRAPYFVYSSLLLLAGAAFKSIWILSFPAMAGGYLWLLAFVNIGWSIAAGFCLCRIAMARSRDAYGSNGYAALSFIPIANLWLLLKESRNEHSSNRAETVSALSGGGGVVIGFVIIVAAGIASSLIQERLGEISKQARTQPPETLRVIVEHMVASQGVEATLHAMAAEAPTPMQIDSVTTLVTIAVNGTELTRTYSVNGPMSEITEEFRARINNAVCSYDPFIPLLSAGAAINEVYVSTITGKTIGAATVTAHNCGL